MTACVPGVPPVAGTPTRLQALPPKAGPCTQTRVLAGLAERVELHRLPSTRPAYAPCPFEQKLTAWRAVLTP